MFVNCCSNRTFLSILLCTYLKNGENEILTCLVFWLLLLLLLLKLVDPTCIIVVWPEFLAICFLKSESNFHCAKRKPWETSFRWFPKTQTKFRNNLVNKLGYCETHNLCYFNQTQEVHFFSKLKYHQNNIFWYSLLKKER